MSKRALMGPRLLHLDVEEYQGVWQDDPINQWESYKNWKYVPGEFTLYWENYFDLSAYQLDALTLNPTSIGLQDLNNYQAYMTHIGGVVCQVLDIVSQDRLDPAVVMDNLQNLNTPPGGPETKQDFQQILFGQFRNLTNSTQFTQIPGLALLTPATTPGRFGSGSPTTVAKLWCYRFVKMANATELSEGDGAQWSSSRFVMSAIIGDEGDLPYLMRQKRSYEIATQGD